MYLGIDVGGTKTLVAIVDKEGQVIAKQERFETPKDYEEFLKDLSQHISDLDISGCTGVVAGFPGLIDREAGVIIALGNLPWRDKPIKADIAAMTQLPITLENDSKLAGLAEAQLVKDTYSDVLFLTISTGINGALLKNGKLVHALRDAEMGKIPIMFKGKLESWEDFASGRGVVDQFNQKADDVTDPAIWEQIGLNIAYGMGVLCSVLQPETVILGGPVGRHLDQYKQYVADYLEKNLHTVVRRPKAILAAQQADEAVIMGCYYLAKQIYAKTT
ncbi:MAG TPA: ROK family protein [Candidatus Saccharimonadales bacterium]|jgi:glucokinase